MQHIHRRGNVNQFRPFSVGRRQISGFGDGANAVKGASAGATVGSVIPVIGTAVGAIVGAVAGYFVHTGQGPQRAAQAAAIDSALAQMPTANHQGAQIPWNGSATAPGLAQFLSALMTSGIFLGDWDGSVRTSPSVNGHWVDTFIAAVKKVVQAIVSNPVGATVNLDITDAPGGRDAVAGQFSFVNPGISVGPDVISQKIIMGNGGLIYWMVLRTGETTAHATQTSNNQAAQKVFALMIDHAAYDMVPPPPPATISTVANSAPIPVAQIVQPVQTANVQPVQQPVQNTQAMLPPQQVLPAIEQQIPQSQAPIIIQTPQGPQQIMPATPSGMSTTTILIIAAVGAAAIYLLKK
jgi:hypothetical protein